MILETIGGLISKNGSDKQATATKRAGELAYQASQNAIAEQRRQFDATQQNFAPYLGGGLAGFNTYTQDLGAGKYNPAAFDFQAKQYGTYDMGSDSVAQNVLDQAMKRVQASAAARGSLGGGGTLRALQKEGVNYGQQFENQNYNRFQGEEATRYGRATDAYNRDYGAKQDLANRYQGLGQMGMQAAGQIGQFGQNSANQIGQLGMSGAQSLGQGLIGSAQYRAQGNNDLWGNINQGVNNGLELGSRAVTGGRF